MLIREGVLIIIWYKGKIPSSLRPNVWYFLSGGAELKKRSVNSYSQFWKSQVDEQVKSLIEQVCAYELSND